MLGNHTCGTGFFYAFDIPDQEGRIIPCIITNKHVIDGAAEINVELQVMPVGIEIHPDGTAKGETRFLTKFVNLGNLVTRHPDPNVDLCAIAVAELVNLLESKGLALKSTYVGRQTHLPADQREFLRPIEPIVMVGYPNGLWDEHNNRAIVRQGQTASHPLLNWNGKRQFMIDAACFGGSSGSPVFLYEDGLIRTGKDSFTPGSRAVFLGALWGGPVLNAQGRIEAREVPTAMQPVPVTPHMLNLGFVVHASAVEDLRPIMMAKLSQTP
jgi:hypothetical protein